MVAARNKDKIIEKIKKWKYLLLTTAVATGIYVFAEGKMGFQITDSYLRFYSQWRPSVLFYTLVTFATLFYAFDKSKLQFAIVERFSKLSFLVFFIHVIILEILWKYAGHNLFDLLSRNNLGKIAFDPIFFTAVVTVSFSLAYLVHKIPSLKKITG
jgi:peptidoglycan/LPS O-acetylase OafA/YrhL